MTAHQIRDRFSERPTRPREARTQTAARRAASNEADARARIRRAGPLDPRGVSRPGLSFVRGRSLRFVRRWAPEQPGSGLSGAGRVGRRRGRAVLPRGAVRAPGAAHAPRPGMARHVRGVPPIVRLQDPPLRGPGARGGPSQTVRVRRHIVPRAVAGGIRRRARALDVRVRPETTDESARCDGSRRVLATRTARRARRKSLRGGEDSVSGDVVGALSALGPRRSPRRRRRRVGEPRRGDDARRSGSGAVRRGHAHGPSSVLRGTDRSPI